jgi:hypothetical protein
MAEFSGRRYDGLNYALTGRRYDGLNRRQGAPPAGWAELFDLDPLLLPIVRGRGEGLDDRRQLVQQLARARFLRPRGGRIEIGLLFFDLLPPGKPLIGSRGRIKLHSAVTTPLRAAGHGAEALRALWPILEQEREEHAHRPEK